jgi:hypothetical protein
MLVEQRQRAIASLVNLLSKGISETELIELNKLINSWSSNSVGGGWSQERNNNTNIDAGNNGANANNKMNVLRLDDKLNLESHR